MASDDNELGREFMAGRDSVLLWYMGELLPAILMGTGALRMDDRLLELKVLSVVVVGP